MHVSFKGRNESPNQAMRQDFRRNNMLPQHGCSVEDGEGWAKPPLTQVQPLHFGWLPSNQ